MLLALTMSTLVLAQAGPPQWAGVKEWDLVVTRTVSLDRRSDMALPNGMRIAEEWRDDKRCTIRLRLVSEHADESGAEWSGKGRGEGTAKSIRRAVGPGDETLDQRDASGPFEADGELQVDPESRTYRFDVRGGEGMKGTMLTRKQGKERRSPHAETCSAGVTDQPLPASGSTLSGTVTEETPMGGATGPVRVAGSQRVTTTWTLAPRGRVQARLFIEPGPGYDRWLPEGTDSPLGIGSSQLVRLVLEGENGGPPRAFPTQVRVRLVDVSREKGISLNWPRGGNADPDLFFRRERMENVVEVRGEGQEAILEGGLAQWTVPVYSNDYGAFGRLVAEAELPGGVIVVGEVRGAPGGDRLSLPRDDNGNRIADAWEKAVGARSADPESDDDDTRPRMLVKGDGLTLYEEYRGLRTADRPHVRLDPNRPDFFFIDVAQLVDAGQWEALTGFAAHRMEWRHVRSGGESPLDESRSADLRQVDHHEGHAKGRQAHAVWVRAHRGPDDPIEFMGPLRQAMTPEQRARDDRIHRLGAAIPVITAPGSQLVPKTTWVVFINVDRVRSFATSGLEAELRSRASGADAGSASPRWGVTPEQARVLADRLRDNPRQVAGNLPDYLSKATLHELAHSVGLDHHEPHPNLGAPSCVMIYPPHGVLAQRLLGGFPAQSMCGEDTCRPRLRLLLPAD